MYVQELEDQYSPSKWSKRYLVSEVVDVYIKVSTQGQPHMINTHMFILPATGIDQLLLTAIRTIL